MRHFVIYLLGIAAVGAFGSAGPIAAQSQAILPRADVAAGSAEDLSSSSPSSLSGEQLGPDDIIGITVYDAPELSHPVRIDDEGKIRLPMVQQHIQAAGLTPDELEKVIATVLTDEQVMVSPIVTVSVVEYHSRPITVIGAVRTPTTFQATGTVTLLDAITRAGGVADSAGADILVTHSASGGNPVSADLTERIPVRSLLDAGDAASNIRLQPGDMVRVPEGGRIFVVGNVKHPGPFSVTEDSESSILKALSIAGGLDSFASHTAYIYRVDAANGQKDEIPVNLKKILARKSPDVPLYASDMLYVPNSTGLRVSAKTLEVTGSVGIALAGLLIYLTH